MWDMVYAVFWFALGAFSLAGVYLRSVEIADRFDEEKFHDGF